MVKECRVLDAPQLPSCLYFLMQLLAGVSRLLLQLLRLQLLMPLALLQLLMILALL